VSERTVEPAPGAPSPLARRALLLAGVLVAVVVAYLVATATVPRWWAQRVADQVDGSIAAGTGLGLFYGVAFTFLPLLVLSFALRRGRPWRLRGWLAGLAVVLALPNLMTLGIVLGTGSAAHAGERILDVEGPNFRAFTLVGAIAGAVAVVGARYLMASRRRARARASELRDELRRREGAEREAPEGSGGT
jgi:MFS family permease